MNTRHDEVRIGNLLSPEITLREDNDDIYSVNILESTNMVLDTLPIDEITIVVKLFEDPDNGFTPNDYSRYVVATDSVSVDNPLYSDEPEATGAYYLVSDGEGGNQYYSFRRLASVKKDTPVYYIYGDRIEKFYWKNGKRTGRYQYTITAQSAIGMLDDKSAHNGGLYEAASFGDVLSDIVGDYFEYMVLPPVNDILVCGHLPVASRRENLHALLFAYSVVIRKVLPDISIRDVEENPSLADMVGNVLFLYPDLYGVVGVSHTISNDYIYDGDTIDEKDISGVELTEHGFTKTAYDEVVTLFDNTDGSGAVTAQKVIFDTAPCYDLRASEGLTVHEAGVNYAIVSGSGTLVGRAYTHSQRVINMGSAVDDVTSISDNCLINSLNSLYVARRLYDYCTATKVINADIVLTDERPGDFIRMEDAYGEKIDGYIQEMSIDVTSIAKASCKILVDYRPKYFGNAFDRVTKLTGSGTYTVPAGVTELRLVIGGGGQGGYSGQNGGDAQYDGERVEYDEQHVRISFEENADSVGGVGGAGGSGGSGGDILVVVASVNPGDTFDYVCGIGGAGGECEDTNRSWSLSFPGENPQLPGNIIPGKAGTDTVFGPYISSGIGCYKSHLGFTDLLSRKLDGTFDIYSSDGLNGVDGLRGRDKDSVSQTGEVSEEDLANDPQEITFDGVVYYRNGLDGKQDGLYTARRQIYGTGGFGGGAAIGAVSHSMDGGDGTDRDSMFDVPANYGIGGDGGDGGDALDGLDATSLGAGGNGGHGAGGGGAAGVGVGYETRDVEHDDGTYSTLTGKPIHGKTGYGGYGGNGGRGGDGYILVYYKGSV